VLNVASNTGTAGGVMITDNTTENDLLAETIEELGQSLTELQQVIADIKEQVNYRGED
jgi:hypothetical protein